MVQHNEYSPAPMGFDFSFTGRYTPRQDGKPVYSFRMVKFGTETRVLLTAAELYQLRRDLNDFLAQDGVE